MQQEIRFCTANDSARLATSGNGPQLVMAVTWLTHLEHQWRSVAWRPWLEAFAEFTVLRHDSRGCGLSDRDTDRFSLKNWVSDLAGVVDAAGSLCKKTALCDRCTSLNSPLQRQLAGSNMGIGSVICRFARLSRVG
jgi:hypothetical protein